MLTCARYLWPDGQRRTESFHRLVEVRAQVEEDSQPGLQVGVHAVQIQHSRLLEEEQHVLQLAPAHTHSSVPSNHRAFGALREHDFIPGRCGGVGAPARHGRGAP